MATSEEDIRIKEFAGLAGFWMIHWIDKVALSQAGSRTPKIQVHLVELGQPAHNSSFAKIVKDSERPREVVALHVGIIPSLRIGAVYENGVRRAPCFLPEMEISIPLHPEPQMMRVSDEINYAPHFWTCPYRVLNVSEYVLRSALESYCTLVRSAGALFVIPSFEILRVFYAQHSRVSNAIFGSWEQFRGSVASLQKTFVRPDGSWQIYLSKHIGDEFAVQIANLILNPFGLTCAKSIFTFLHSTPSHIVARIPFNEGSLKITAKVLRLQHDPPKFLVIEITRGRWPISMDSVHVDRENSNVVGENQTEIDAPPPFSDGEPDDGPRPPLTSGDDPHNTGADVPYVAPGVVWENMPVKIRVPKELSGIYVGPDRDKPPRPTPEETSAGIPDPGSSPPQATIDASASRNIERFRGLIDALTQLKTADKIDSCVVVPPSAGVLSREGFPCWPFPIGLESTGSQGNVPKEMRLLWSWIDRKKKMQRAALVCETTVKGQVVFIIEIELRRAESGYSALFALGNGCVPNFDELLFKTARSAGVWPGKWPAFGLLFGKSRRHHFSDDDKKITPEWVMRGIESLFSPKGKSDGASNTKRSQGA